MVVESLQLAEPCEYIDYSRIIYPNEKLNSKFLKKLTDTQELIVEHIETNRNHKKFKDLCETYFEMIYILSKGLENNRALFGLREIPEFRWVCPDGFVYSSTCWRFEIIMSGYLYASILYNEDNKESLTRCLSILRTVCLEQILAWPLRDETKLPFEATEDGMRCIISLCMLKLQNLLIFDSYDTASCIAYYRWVYEESSCLLKALNSRHEVGACQHIPSQPIVLCRLEALGNMCKKIVHSISSEGITSSYNKGYTILNSVIRLIAEQLNKYKKKDDSVQSLRTLHEVLLQERSRLSKSAENSLRTIKDVEAESIWHLVDGLPQPKLCNEKAFLKLYDFHSKISEPVLLVVAEMV